MGLGPIPRAPHSQRRGRWGAPKPRPPPLRALAPSSPAGSNEDDSDRRGDEPGCIPQGKPLVEKDRRKRDAEERRQEEVRARRADLSSAEEPVPDEWSSDRDEEDEMKRRADHR